MVRIKNEHDLETLRQIALLVDNENQRLVNENVRLRVELARLHGVPETEQLELSVLKQLQEKRESIFRIDEKRTRKKTKAKKNKKKGHGPREQPHLPVVDKVIELAETEKKCSVCDGELGEMAGQYEESESGAVRYMLERWETLTLFAENPLVWLDNNHAERALREPVVGRKNHYGSRTKRGTDVAALFYTLCETAKLQNVDPRAYMLEAAYAAINQPGTVSLPDALRDNSAA